MGGVTDWERCFFLLRSGFFLVVLFIRYPNSRSLPSPFSCAFSPSPQNNSNKWESYLAV